MSRKISQQLILVRLSAMTSALSKWHPVRQQNSFSRQAGRPSTCQATIHATDGPRVKSVSSTHEWAHTCAEIWGGGSWWDAVVMWPLQAAAGGGGREAGREGWVVAAGRPGRPVSDEVMVHVRRPTELTGHRLNCIAAHIRPWMFPFSVFSAFFHPSAVLRLFTLHSLTVVCLLLRLISSLKVIFFYNHECRCRRFFFLKNPQYSKKQIS